MKKAVLLILVDGLRHDYINPLDSPFLYSLCELNIDGIIRETFAFELRPAFFAGLQPEECNVANMFCYNPDESPFRSINVRHGDRKKISRDLRTEAAERGYSLVKHVGTAAEIPLELLKYFDFSEKYHTTDPSAIPGHKTIFDYLRQDSKRWLWIGYPDYPGTTKRVLEEFKKKSADDIDFFYLHFSELDWVGHEYGPHSYEQKRTLKEIDEAIREVYKRLNQTFTEVRGIIFGDHGEVEIKKNIDIENLLKGSGLIVEKDYIYFLDSTQARFWFFNETAKNKVIELLSTVPEGMILSETDYTKLRFRFKHNKFGDLIFVVKEGIGIFPNFFQSEKSFKGLHGYLPEVEGNWAKLIITGCGINRHLEYPLEMVDIFPTLLELLGYEKSADILTKSVFERIGVHMEQDRYIATVVIPTFNRLETLKKNIACIENQTYNKDGFELIVIDDGSADGTGDFLEEYKKNTALNFKYFRQENSGPAAARNEGIRKACGRIIILVGDDMLMESSFIEYHVKFHLEWPQLSHACLGFIDWSKDIEVNVLMELITSKKGGQQFSYDMVFERDPDNIGCDVFLSSNISFKRLLSLTHALFNDKVFKHAMWEDIELGYRLERAGLVIHFRKNCIVYHEHEMIFEGFAERQKMVGWYSHDLHDIGIETEYSAKENEKNRIYSKKTLMDIVKALSKLEEDHYRDNSAMLRDMYNSGLRYAALVGYLDRKNELNEDSDASTAIMFNALLADHQLLEKDRQLTEKDRQLQEKEMQIQYMLNSRSWRITAPLRWLYRKFYAND